METKKMLLVLLVLGKQHPQRMLDLLYLEEID